MGSSNIYVKNYENFIIYGFYFGSFLLNSRIMLELYEICGLRISVRVWVVWKYI